MLVERVKSAAEDEGRNMEEEPRALSPAEQEYWTIVTHCIRHRVCS